MEGTGRLFLIVVYLTTAFATDCKHSFKLTFSSNTTRPYVKLSTISSELSDLSLCFWVRTANETSRTVFSYALPKRDNEIMAAVATSLKGDGFVTFHRQTQNAEQIKGSIIKDITKPEDKMLYPYKSSFKGTWQHVCILWSAWSGKCRVYINGSFATKKEGVAIDRPVERGGVIVLGQDQDVFGGAFEEQDGFRGDLSELHLWDRELEDEEVTKLANCKLNEEGNIVNWSKMKMVVYNGVQISPVKLPCLSTI